MSSSAVVQNSETVSPANQRWWVDGAECTICLQKIKERGVPFECRIHAYCYDCIVAWTTTTPRCPICRVLITRILKCTTPREVLATDWTKIRPLKLREVVKNALTEEEAELFDQSEDDFNSLDAAGGENSDDHELPSTPSEITSSTSSEEKEDAAPRRYQTRSANSYWDDNLSREPTFTGRRGISSSASKSETEDDEDDDDWEGDDSKKSEDDHDIAFSLVPGEHRPFRVRRRVPDGDYQLDALFGGENAQEPRRSARRPARKRRRVAANP